MALRATSAVTTSSDTLAPAALSVGLPPAPTTASVPLSPPGRGLFAMTWARRGQHQPSTRRRAQVILGEQGEGDTIPL